MSSRRERRKAIRRARADAHRANCERGHWKAAALLLGFAESLDADHDYRLVVYGHGVHFEDAAANPWKYAVAWWEEFHERCNCFECSVGKQKPDDD